MTSHIFLRRPCALPGTVLVLTLLGACSKPSPDDLMAAAQRHIRQHDDAAAQIELRNLIQMAPGNPQAHRLLGTVLLRLRDPVAAESVLRKSLSLGDRPDEVVPALALALLEQGQPQRVIDEFGQTKLHDPAANAALLAGVGQARLSRAEVRAAAEAFGTALSMQPGNAVALLGQARIAAHDGKLNDALALSDAALKGDARYVEAYVFMAQLWLAKDQRPVALERLEKALAVDRAYTPARLALASLLIDSKDHEKAKTVLAAAGGAARDPRVLLLQALLAMRQGDLSNAKNSVMEALKGAPEYGPALALAGEIELRSGNHALAEQHLSKAIRLDESPGLRRLLATAQLRQHRTSKALATLQPLLQGGGAKEAGLAMLAGEAHLANGDIQRAGEFFEAAKSLGGYEAQARTRLGQVALTQGDFERGVQELQAASTLGPQAAEPDLLLVSLHLRRQEPAKALAAAQAFIQKQPQNPVGHVMAGIAHAMRLDRAAARASFDAALKIKPDHVPALRALADLDVTESRPSDAQRRYDALLAKKPDDEQVLTALASLQERMGRANEAAETLRRAITANPRAREPVVALVQLQLRRKDAAVALEVAQAAVRTNPDELDLAVLLGMTQEAAGAGKDAIRTLTALVLKEPHAVGPLVRLAQIQARQGDFEGAAKTLLRAQEKAPQNDGLTRDLVKVYLQAGKPDLAISAAKDLQARKADSAAGHLLEGDVRAYARKWPEAERSYRTALKIEPRAGAAAGQIYRVLQAAGKKQEADTFAADWVARHPSDVGMRLLVADVALRSRNLPLAVQQYEDVLRLKPDQPAVLNNLAWALGQTKDPRAIGIAERAASLAPLNPDVLDTLGMLYLQAGDSKRSLELLQRARDLAPERPDLRLHFAKGLLQSGRAQEGKSELRELAAAKSDFPGKADIPALLATR